MKLKHLILMIFFLGSSIGIGFEASEMRFPKEGGFSNWSICRGLFDYIVSFLEPDQILLELGSGSASGLLSQHFTVYSIEHDQRWVGKYNTNYIHAPIDENGWYDTTVLKKQLPATYHMILVDGPTGAIGREGFLYNLDLFNVDVPIIFDDVDRKAEYDMMVQVAELLGRDFVIHTYRRQQFGVIMP